MDIVSGRILHSLTDRERRRRVEREKRRTQKKIWISSQPYRITPDINGTRQMPVPEDVQTGVISETAKQNMARGAVSPLPTPKTPIMQGDDSKMSLRFRR